MDPYVYPGTDTLKNNRGIREPEQLRSFEADATTRRLTELRERPNLGSFDANHLRDTHRYIFQDAYPWAGQVRTVNISRANQFPYAFPDRIDGALKKTFLDLRTERSLAGLDRERFAARAAHYLGEINAVHPFREGNGRTQREFIRQLAQANGHAIDWRRVSREQMYEASARSFQHGDNAGLEEVVRACLAEPAPQLDIPARFKARRPRDRDERERDDFDRGR